MAQNALKGDEWRGGVVAILLRRRVRFCRQRRGVRRLRGLVGGGVADGIGYGENGSTEVDKHGNEGVAEVVDADRGQVSCGCVVGEEGVDTGFVYRGFAAEEERGLRGVGGEDFFQRCADGRECDCVVFSCGDFIGRAVKGMAGIGFREIHLMLLLWL